MGQNIKIQQLLKAYRASTDPVKALLEAACGKELLSGNVMDRVKTIRDACEETSRDYDFEFGPERTKYETPDETAYREIKIFYEALNEGVEIDFYNTQQKKWYAWVVYASGRGLSLVAVYCGSSFTGVGPRLCCVREELVRYAFTQINDSFQRFYNNHKKQ